MNEKETQVWGIHGGHIGLDLKLVSQEKDVGPFRDEGINKRIIER